MQIIENISHDDYLDAFGVSASLLKQIARSPAHAEAWLNAENVPTAAMRFGSAFHAFVLEPAEFHARYSVFNGDRRTKVGKAEYDAIISTGRTPISPDDYATIAAMANAIGSHSTASDLIRNPEAKAEVSVFWEDDETGMLCKCRPDLWIGDTIVDVKTTDDASPEGFARSIAKYGYGMQAAHYLKGTGAARFLFVAVEKSAPHAVAVYELDQFSLDYCRETRSGLLSYWNDCIIAATYPGYSDDVQIISLPNYLLEKDDGDITI